MKKAWPAISEALDDSGNVAATSAIIEAYEPHSQKSQEYKKQSHLTGFLKQVKLVAHEFRMNSAEGWRCEQAAGAMSRVPG